MNKLKESNGKMLAVIKEKRGLISTAIFIVLIVIAVLAAQRALDYPNLKKEIQTLQASISEKDGQLDEAGKQAEAQAAQLAEAQDKLTYEESQVQQLKESTNALKDQVSGLEAEKEDLNNQLEELLRVQETVPVITRTSLDQKIESLSELVTKKYWYRNATAREEAKEWLWGTAMPFSDIRFVALYDGYITVSIDLKEVKFNVNQQTKTITVTMPKSKIFDHNIPQETINVLEVKNNLFNSVSFNDYNRFISGEKVVMEEVAIEHGILTEAEEEAKKIIEAFLAAFPGIDQYKLVFKQST